MERLICTGSSKTGTHALLKAVSLFYGHIDLPEHAHHPHWFKKEGRKYLHITRDPRNTLISWLRYNRIKLTPENIIREIPVIIKENQGYVGWLSDEEAFNVRFEELLTDPAVIQSISESIGLPLVEDHYSKIWGRTKTFTGNLSNWEDYWSYEVETAWISNGGPELEEVLGYAR